MSPRHVRLPALALASIVMSMTMTRFLVLVLAALALVAASCGGSDSASTETQEAAPTTNGVAGNGATTTETTAPATGATDPTVAAEPPAEPTAAVPAFVGEWPNRFCVSGVESTLNLRAAPSTDAEILASIPPASCNLVSGGIGLEDNFQPVIYTTIAGATEGWVSNNFITFQDPPDRIEAAALLFVEAWQLGLDTGQYSYGIDVLPDPIRQGDPVLAEMNDSGVSGCELIGDITVECDVVLVEQDGTEVARINITGSQRGANGYDGEPYFEADFPDGPTIMGISVSTS